jgi:aminoglycoside phosphotransferase (APT) family kinase protein
MVPDLDDLTLGLTTVFNTNEFARGSLNVVHRERSPYSTTFPCEIVTCRFQDGSELRLFCKYTGGVDYTGHGHRGKVEHEIAVYRDVLRPLDLSQPVFYGGYTDSQTGQHWLVLEYLDDCLRVQKVEGAVLMAARWIARFHVANQARLATLPAALLKIYDHKYYLGWVRRTYEFAGSLHKRFPWLATLCQRSEELLPALTTTPRTVIHGEYYPKNILFHRGRICPVDWESAAVADGLIDLAVLTEGWGEKMSRQIELEYQQARWPNGAPTSLARLIDIARLYVHFRWLGDVASATHSEQMTSRFELLLRVGERLDALQ